MRKLGPVIIDPRRHDAVLIDLDAVVTSEGSALDSAATLIRQLHEIGVGTAVFSARRDGRDALDAAGIGDLVDVHRGGPVETAARLGVRPGRCVVVANDAAGVTAGRDGGFALVIGVDRTGHRDELRRFGADAVVADLDEVSVRTGDRRMSQLPDALQALGLADDVLQLRCILLHRRDGGGEPGNGTFLRHFPQAPGGPQQGRSLALQCFKLLVPCGERGRGRSWKDERRLGRHLRRIAGVARRDVRDLDLCALGQVPGQLGAQDRQQLGEPV